MGKTRAQAIWDACQEIAFPKLLIMLCILAVFAPAFMMSGIPGSLFMPLAMAIGFSMIVSFILSQTFVPVMANWMMKHDPKTCENHKPNWFTSFRDRFTGFLSSLMKRRKIIVSVSLAAILCIGAGLYQITGKDVLPSVNSRQFQVRIKAAEGTGLKLRKSK
jgi:multidrug efflux pump subunit AcrB